MYKYSLVHLVLYECSDGIECFATSGKSTSVTTYLRSKIHFVLYLPLLNYFIDGFK